VRQLQAWMKTTQNPHYEGYFDYGLFRPHCYSGEASTPERLKEMAAFGVAHMPEGRATPWWRRSPRVP